MSGVSMTEKPDAGRLNHAQVSASVEVLRASRVVVRWDANTENAVRELYEALLSRHLPNIAPPWLGELFVGYDETAGAESTMTIRSCPEYRWSRLTVCPPALNHTVREREAHLVHELFHLPLEAMHHEHAAVKGFVPEKMIGYVDEQWRRAWEGAVCDLTASYLRLNALHG